MKLAIVEKQPSNIKYEKYFKFDFDKYTLISGKKTKILKADIELDFTKLDDYDFVITVGAEPTRFLAGVGSVVTYAGQLLKEKFIPIFSPAMVSFKPEIRPAFEQAVEQVEKIINGDIVADDGTYTFIQDEIQAIQSVAEALKQPNKFVAIDTETTALYPKNGYVLGISLSWKEHQGIYIDSNCITEDVEELMQKLISEKTMVFHNAKFDMKMLEYHFSFEFDKWEDSMLLHYLLNENESHGLKYLAMRYTTMGDYEAPLDEFKNSYCKAHKVKKSDFTYDLIPPDILADYAAKDTDATIRLFNKFWPIVSKAKGTLWKAYNDILKPSTLFLKDCEMNGVPFRTTKLVQVREELEDELFSLNNKLYKFKEVGMVEKVLGGKFNPNSTAQLAKLFFDVLGLPVISKTATGAPSTDANVLQELSEMHDIPKIVSKIRKLTKIKNTYIDKVIANLDGDGKLRTNFNLTTTTSGRLSSSGKLNMQQLPRDDKRVKDCIASPDPDYVIVSQDLQTAEMYYAAVLSGDKNLQKVFINGEDFHSSIAHMIFKLPCKVEEVGSKFKDKRQQAKAVSFGILYGAGAKTVAEQANCSMSDAQNAITQYFATFGKLKRWLDQMQHEAQTKGALYSALGRKRRVPNVLSSDKKEASSAIRSAVNFLIQSLASDINLLAAVDMHNYILKKGMRAQIFGLVHDSILSVVHKDDLKLYALKLQEFTQKDRGVGIPGTPVNVDLEIGTTYAFKDEIPLV